MAQHFLLSSKAKTLTLATVFRMSDAEAEATFRKVRWPETEGAAVCPSCGCLGAYEFRRHTGALRFECNAKECRKEFSITNDTGEFSFTPLPDGFYKVEVRKPGFALYEAGEISLKSSEPVKVDVVLNIGRIQETVNVRADAAAPAANPQPNTVPKRIRVGGNVQASKLIFKEHPLYPADCKAERLEGTVLLSAVISREGVPISLEQVNQLVDARFVKVATDAVRQWRYQPTLLNGEPVEIISMIQVNFTLAQ